MVDILRANMRLCWGLEKAVRDGLIVVIASRQNN
jgi:hypothetical protein